MSIRERKWTTKDGEKKSAWVVDYFDQNGKRHIKTFKLKKDAKDFDAGTRVEVKGRVHVADSETVTVKEACGYWLTACEDAGLERTTLAQYRQHVDLHIIPFVGDRRLNEVTVPFVRTFLDDLRANGRSAAMVRNVRVSLGSVFSDAQERGLVVRNAVKEIGRGKQARARSQARHVEPAEVGVDIPTPDEIRAVMAKAAGRDRVFWMTAIFTGMRASELRGLRWADVDLSKATINVRQRADAYQQIGSPKSVKGRRTIPLVSSLVTALKEWKLACPKGDAGLVFPNGAGNVEYHANIIKRWFHPPQIEAGVVINSKDKNGKPVKLAKYSGLHSLRHFYASWCINSPADGGLGLTPKVVQERMGHSSIQVTLDTYSHLFKRAGTGDEMDAAAAALLG